VLLAFSPLELIFSIGFLSSGLLDRQRHFAWAFHVPANVDLSNFSAHPGFDRRPGTEHA